MIPVRTFSAARAAVLLLAALVLAGCWELHRQVTLNPDGSARVRVVRTLSAQAARQMQMGGSEGLETMARDQAADLVRGARGVDAWTDVEWSVGEDSLHFSGTAYVPDLAEFRLGDPSGDDDPAMAAFAVERTDQGLEIVWGPADDEEDEEPLPSPLSEEEALERARTAQREARQARAMAAGLFTGMRETVELTLPAEPTGVEGFERAGDRVYRATFEGEKLIQVMGAVLEMSAEELAARLREAAAEGKGQEEALGDLMLERWEGMPARLVVPTGGEARFDYEAEAAEAAEAYEELKERLGITGGGPAAGTGADGAAGQPEGATEQTGAAPADPGPGSETGGEAAAGTEAAQEDEPVVQGPPRVVSLELGLPGLAGSLDVGTTLTISLPAVAGTRRLGLVGELRKSLSVTDDRGRDLVAASHEARRAWQEANPTTGSSREATSWRLRSIGFDPSLPTVEVELWATPSPGARTLRVRGEVPVRTLPTATDTAEVPAGRIADGARLTLGDHEVTLAGAGSMTSGGERSRLYEVEGGVVVTAVLRGGETLSEIGQMGGTRLAVPDGLADDPPLRLVYGPPGIRRVPVDLEFGLGLGEEGSGD